MKKNLFVKSAAFALATVLACTAVYAKPAPDGSTRAEDTPAAANGAYDAWKTKWAAASTDWTIPSVTVGADATQINFAWYTIADSDTFVYGKDKSLSDAKSAEVSVKDAQPGYKSCKVTLTGLEPSSTYWYKIADKEAQSFTTADPKAFSFIFVGDPQIGSSNPEKAKKPEDIAKPSFKKAQYEAVQSDSFNWDNTLNQAMVKTNSKAAFILSAGDQIQTNAKKVKDNTISEMEYAGFLLPQVLRNVPFAPTVGNHDADNKNYQYHFSLPNMSSLADNGYAGGDYSFRYGNAVFMMLNTQSTNTADHEEFIKQTLEANKDAKWKIVALHQDIYGSAEHSNEPEIVNLRYALVPIFQQNKIDVVLTGHDHAYSRSQILNIGNKTVDYTDDEFDESLEKDIDEGNSPKTATVAAGNIKKDSADEADQKYLSYLESVMDSDGVVKKFRNKATVKNPKGILYMTANSASGSKYYDLTARGQTYIAARWQEDVPTYSVVEIDADTFSIVTYRTDTNEAIDKKFTIIKK